jgi:hypothetical protein
MEYSLGFVAVISIKGMPMGDPNLKLPFLSACRNNAPLLTSPCRKPLVRINFATGYN